MKKQFLAIFSVLGLAAAIAVGCASMSAENSRGVDSSVESQGEGYVNCADSSDC